eukprot:CAMPEP_0196653300 /NCGR_PEP_ID=MMETSP1086-20130531/2922_1 /TAXON_ID=77921 /ORGANISM="Cyanoptyche  gloeocystis , Strain SAG4.97" /LENGTH=318 /DNA_ID=CAMNT_0041984427 /DNA_START=52 /DNA_END=1009 /DNA_ORIENTATION=+
MAEHLASIFGTEKDKVNCPFYFKIGACRHGDRCSRLHNKPSFSQTIVLQNMYQNPMLIPLLPDQTHMVDEKFVQKHFEEFYEDVFDESSRFGNIEEMHVCDNSCDHLVGNIYIKYTTEEAATDAVNALNGRFYAGRMIRAEFSPVTDFREAAAGSTRLASAPEGGPVISCTSGFPAESFGASSSARTMIAARTQAEAGTEATGEAALEEGAAVPAADAAGRLAGAHEGTTSKEAGGAENAAFRPPTVQTLPSGVGKTLPRRMAGGTMGTAKGTEATGTEREEAAAGTRTTRGLLLRPKGPAVATQGAAVATEGAAVAP